MTPGQRNGPAGNGTGSGTQIAGQAPPRIAPGSDLDPQARQLARIEADLHRLEREIAALRSAVRLLGGAR